MALTPEQRRAQRALVGIITSGTAVLTVEYLSIWREEGCEEFMTSAPEITAYLETLEVPYHVAIAPGPTKRTSRIYGWDVRISWDDLPSLERWVPSFRRHMDAVEDHGESGED